MPIEYKICLVSEILENLDFSDSDINRSEMDSTIKDYVSYLKPNLSAYIEFPYVDKMYRDAYYNYYATLNRIVERDCIRVSLFNTNLTKDHFLNEKLRTKLQKEDVFLGYFIVKPTSNRRIGRSFINPKALKKSSFISCRSESRALVHGVDLKTYGFPHSSQDGKVHTCAETSIWALMEYFGAKYSYFRNVLPSTIIAVLKKVTYERQIPSKGLGILQMGFALRKFGFGSKLYTEGGYGKQRLKIIINDYIESGIPLLVVLEEKDKKIRHAYIMIGHEKRGEKQEISYSTSPIVLTQNSENKKNTRTKSIKITDSLHLYEKKFIIIDDNFFPYQRASLQKPCSYSKSMRDSRIIGIVVPLYPKIYLDSVAAKNLSYQLLINDFFGLKLNEDRIITRLLLTSTRSFRRVIAKDNLMPDTYKNFILTSIMPKFIWVMEITTKELYLNNKGLGFLVLDSTSEEKDNFDDVLLFIFYSDRVIVKDGNGIFRTTKPKQEKFNLFVNNLK